MDVKRLAWFLCVAETGSLSKAALQLQVSHSMLSRGIQELEQELGHRLFHRTGRGMHATEFGRRLAPLAQRATLEVTRFTNEAKALRGKLSGTVAIGLPGSIAARLVGPLVQLARERYPELQLRFVEGLSGGVEEWLAARRIDIGLVFAREDSVKKGAIPLARSSLYLVGPAGDPLTAKRAVPFAQLSRCAIMLPCRPHSVRTMVEDACNDAGFKLNLLCEIDSLLAIKETVVAGCGYTISGYDSVANDVGMGRLQAAPIKDPTISRVLVMTTGPKHSITTATRAVAALISSVAAALVAKGTWVVGSEP
ncbi:HTH-type transcriptional regulator CynR [Burkholderiales bacterium]|nr:HTH-type transcriptional regulator CynR [Burkholderiales bacterium]